MYLKPAGQASRYRQMVKAQEIQSNSMSKSASMWGSGGGTSPGAMLGGGPVSRMAMKPISPIYQESNLMLPKDRKTMNAYNRHYYETDYWVGNVIDLHTYYPLGGFSLISKDKVLETTMRQAADRVDLLNLVLGLGLEYWVYGEAVPFLEWNKEIGMWDRATLFNPDLVEVKRTIFMNTPLITLIPDSELKRLATSTHPSDIILRDQIPSKVLEFVLRGENIPLNARNVSHIVRRSLPHDLRGTSIIQRVWKELMLRDAFREVLFVIAQNHITPLKIFKIGGKDEEYYPDQNELGMWQGIIEEAQNDPNFSIITHKAFDVEYKGATGQIVDVTKYLEIIESNVLTGLFASKAMTSGEGPTYANAQVAYEILQKRYVFFRNVIEQWLVNKFFLPISIAHGFKKDDSYAVPQIKWQRMDFKRDADWVRLLQELWQGEGEKKMVSDRTMVTEAGFDYDEEQELLMHEKAARIAMKEKAKEDKAAGGEGGGLPGMGGMPGMDLGGGGGGALPPLEGLGGMGGGEGAPVPGGEAGGAPPPTSFPTGGGAAV